MDLMTLMAHITLDTSEYEKALDDAQKEAARLNIQEDYSLGLDNSDFMSNISEAAAEADSFTGPEDQSLALDTSEFTEGIENAEGEAEAFQGNLDAVWEGIKSGLKVAGVGAAIAALMNQLAECVNLASQLGDNVDKGSKRLNISAEAYQEWGHVLNQSGANINDLQRGILAINKLLGGGEVAKAAADAFNTLGVSTTNAAGGLKTTEEYLADTINALADFEGTSEERGALVEAIFGRNGNQLNAMLDEGSSGIAKLTKEAHDLGLVMTNEEVANSVAYGDAVANVQASMDALKTSITTEILPGLTDVMNTTAKIIAFFNWRNGDTSLEQQFKSIDEGSMDALASVNATESVAMQLADKLIAMGDASKLTAEQQEKWKGIANELIGIVPTLSGVIDTDTGSISGNTGAIQENIKEWANLTRARALAEAKQEKQKALIDANREAIDAQVAMTVKEAEAETARAEAIEAVNNVLDKHNMSDRRLGADASAADIAQLRSDIGFGRNTTELQKELAAAEEIYGAHRRELEGMQRDFAELQEQLAQAQADYDAWEDAAEKLFGTASSSAEEAEGKVGEVGTAINDLPERKTITIDVLARYPKLNLPGLTFTPHKSGAWDIPYDDYPALLHKDEMVLTAAQAKEYRHDRGGMSDQHLSSIIDAMQDMQYAISNMKLFVGSKEFARVVGEVADTTMYRRINNIENSYARGYGT